MSKYLINNTLVYRVPTVADALELRSELQNTEYATLTNFGYTTKYIKQKGEIVDEYQLVKAKLEFTSEKEPDTSIIVNYDMEF